MELVSRTNTSIATVYNLCGEQSMTYSLCKGVLQKFIGYDPSRNLNRNLARIMSYTRGGTSVPAAYQIWHMFKKNRPLRFDALPPGRDSKYLRYLKKDMGETPKGGQAPGRGDVYDVTKMNVPTIIWYSMNDRLVDQEGIKKLASLAPHIIKLNLISYKPFNHYDYWIHEDINTHVTYDLMDQLNAFLKPNSVPM
ncbi:lipase member K-like isoform X2 [Diaphorina citri]|uniref:Lipase member K-like isoform X2 n=1 Tax=Diaphorina citri TaxID=121845 RepID=A0A1S3CWV1_DIACI|nr:lipase member K-like isoform X2 [Diaphorina citri]